MKALGELPEQISAVLLALLSKPTAGYRPIGVFCSWHRVWRRLRRRQALTWGLGHPRRYWADGGNRGASDAVWRQSVLAEHGTAAKEVSCSVFYDMLKYYETIDLDMLLAKCRRRGFPQPIARLCMLAFRCGRLLSLGGIIMGPSFVDKGVVA
eukprot:565426-Pyramimonas_sp.AAC.1